MSWSHSLSFIFFPWHAIYDPVDVLVNADETVVEGQSELGLKSREFVENKISELTLVGVLCALLAATVSAGFSWNNAPTFAWPARALWYSALFFSLSSICIATQQTVALRRLSVHRAGPQKLRHLLGLPDRRNLGKYRPRESQLWAWQIPIILLNYGIIAFCVGLGFIVWQDAVLTAEGVGYRETKVAIASSVTALIAVFCYVSCLFSMYGATGKDDV